MSHSFSQHSHTQRLKHNITKSINIDQYIDTLRLNLICNVVPCDVNFTGWNVWYRLQRFGWHHFQWRKISRDRHHKNYLDKSEIGSTRNPERSSHQILWKWKKFIYWKQKTNTYSVSEQKDKNRHESSKQFRPKVQ